MMYQLLLPKFALAAALFARIGPVIGDSNDWVNVDYVVRQFTGSLGGRSSTDDAQATIIRGADSTTLSKPWTIRNSNNVIPPSEDPHDYMSWAPYHWPNCNWCSSTGRTHLVHPGGGTDNTSPSSDNSGHSDNHVDHSTSPSDGGDGFEESVEKAVGPSPQANRPPAYHRRRDLRTNINDPDTPLPPPQVRIENPPLPLQPLSGIGSLPATSGTASPTTGSSASNTAVPAQAAAKTGKVSCTPSPTQAVAPSTSEPWTTCPYVVRDGQLNPDVRTLNGPGAINSVSQAIFYNAIAYAIQKSASYSHNVARFIDTFFLDPSTRMNPNMNYGQIVRGPGPKGSSGTFTGILDLRGLVKVVNALLIMNVTASADWTDTRNQAMGTWMSQYTTWLTESELGKRTASCPNNHGSFYVSQVAAARMLAGDNRGAAAILRRYFETQFLDQIAASGEQPFEAVRTRPYHYRCFNLEAMITNAKLGDQLGLNLWGSKSKYGATIQTAAEFLMATDPKNEDAQELLPHIASVAAAYGDHTGRYAAYLNKLMPNYRTKPFWYYDQTIALPSSPAAKMSRRSVIWAREDYQPVPFECPKVFEITSQVEIDNEIFVTCDMLKPFYASISL